MRGLEVQIYLTVDTYLRWLWVRFSVEGMIILLYLCPFRSVTPHSTQCSRSNTRADSQVAKKLHS